MKSPLLLFAILLSANLFSQEPPQSAASIEGELAGICRSLFSAKSDADRGKYNDLLLRRFEEVLTDPASFDMQFDSLKKDMAVLPSPDGRFRIINWNVPKEDGTQMYYGFIQEKFVPESHKLFRKIRGNTTYQLYPLIDKSAEIRNPDNSVSDNKKWYGMLYYRIIEKHTKSRTYYTLLAWDGNDNYSQKKVIDVLTFDNAGIPHFGADIFVMQKKYPKRIFFEYSKSCTMSVRYSSKKDSIVFDHLAPTEPQLEGQYQYYCSDMSYDGFGWKHGKWTYGMDVQALNERDENDKKYHDPHDKSPGHDQSNTIISRDPPKKK